MIVFDKRNADYFLKVEVGPALYNAEHNLNLRRNKTETETCLQCKTDLERVKFDIGYGIEVESLHCKKCGFNITEDNKLEFAISSLHEQISKEIKIIKVGSGLGVRFPNDIVKNYK